MRTVLWILTLLLVVLMATQWSLHLGYTEKPVTRTIEVRKDDGSTVTEERTDTKKEGGVRVTPGDALLALVFLLWLSMALVTREVFRVRWPLLAAFVLVGLLLLSALFSPDRGAGLREAVQLGAYFIGGWFVFANCIDTRRRLRAAVGLFSLVVAAIVLLALWQYRAELDGNLFYVSGTFGNRNVLGAFFAVALPFLFALGLYERRLLHRFALFLTVAFGAAVTLSGGALIALAVALLFVAALRSHAALLAVLLAVVLAVTLVPRLMPLREQISEDPPLWEGRHADVVLSSVEPFLHSNYLDWRSGPPEWRDAPVVAARYRRWYAAVGRVRGSLTVPTVGEDSAPEACERRHQALRRLALGVGPGRYSEAVAPFYGSGPAAKPDGDTDVVAGYNIEADEPDSFNMFLVTCVEAGPFALAALLWVGALLLGRNAQAHARCRDAFGRALALGAAGAVIGAAVCSVFSNILVRGVAMPFLFVALSGILWARLPEGTPPEQPAS
jgi:hypothetical protein